MGVRPPLHCCVRACAAVDLLAHLHYICKSGSMHDESWYGRAHRAMHTEHRPACVHSAGTIGLKQFIHYEADINWQARWARVGFVLLSFDFSSVGAAGWQTAQLCCSGQLDAAVPQHALGAGSSQVQNLLLPFMCGGGAWRSSP